MKVMTQSLEYNIYFAYPINRKETVERIPFESMKKKGDYEEKSVIRILL